MHLPFPTYCRQPPTRWLQRHLHAFLRRCPLGTDFATSLAGSSIVQAESRSLSLRSTGFLLSCSPPRLAATQLLFGYHLLAWFQCAGSPTRRGLCCSTAHEGRHSCRPASPALSEFFANSATQQGTLTHPTGLPQRTNPVTSRSNRVASKRNLSAKISAHQRFYFPTKYFSLITSHFHHG